MDTNLQHLLLRAIERLGEAEVRRRLHLLSSTADQADMLTIIVNVGSHPIPNEYVIGDVFVAYEGTLDLTSEEIAYKQIESILIRLGSDLKKKRYKQITLITTGHSIISMLIKLLVYRMTHIETCDIIYAGEGRYLSLQFDLKSIAQKA